MAPVDAPFDHLVVGLEEDGPVAEVVEEGVDGGLDIEAVEPKGEDAGFAFAFGIKVFDLGFFFFGDGIEAGVRVEEVGDEGEVEFRVAGDEGGGGEEFAAGELIGVGKDLFRALEEVGGLERGAGACIWGELR